MQHNTIENETEALRQLVIAARKDAKVEPEAEACINRLNTLYKKHPDLFTPEDVRFVNVLRGQLGSRLEAHKPGGPYARIAKPKGVKLDHCWRCETPLDERFTEACATCSTKAIKALVCPVCKACGCQSAGKVLV
ncbi:MAG TPA: hypothetical protein VHR66_04095 [Gemmataceae bacterium]|nr:hypothetical protein [Gemmataceae bacterium]